MKLKSLFVTLCTLLFINASIAQTSDQSYVERAPTRTKQMTADLNLDKDQAEKLASLNLETAKKLDEVKGTATFEDEYKKIEAEYEENLKAFLSAEQFEKYKSLKARKEMMKSKKK